MGSADRPSCCAQQWDRDPRAMPSTFQRSCTFSRFSFSFRGIDGVIGGRSNENSARGLRDPRGAVFWVALTGG